MGGRILDLGSAAAARLLVYVKEGGETERFLKVPRNATKARRRRETEN